MRTHRFVGVLVAACIGLSSCGTFFSRGWGAHPFGRYPFQAVAADAVMIASLFESKVDIGGADVPGWNLMLWGLFSLPVDLVADALASPVDAIAWAFGVKKKDDPPARQ